MSVFGDGWTADDWVKHLTRPDGPRTVVSATITRGPRRDLVHVVYRDELGKRASIRVRLGKGKQT